MDISEAFDIVLDLAIENSLSEQEAKENNLIKEFEKQQKALSILLEVWESEK